MKLKKVKLKELKICPYNPRKMSKEMLEKLKTSLVNFGYVNPLLINTRTGHVVGGNQRLTALREMYGEDHEIDVVEVSLKDNEEKTLNIALNKVVGDWDFEKLGDILQELPREDLNLTGFEEDEISKILDDLEPEEEKPFDTDKAYQKPKYDIKKGEIWKLGNHRLMCGDATNSQDIGNLLANKKANMVFIDPPYGVGIGKKNKSLDSVGIRVGNLDDLESDDSVESASELWDKSFENINTFLENGAYYITAPQGGDHEVMMMMMKKNNIPCRHELIWVKNQPAFSMGRLDYDYMHEPILYGWKGKHTFYGTGEHTKSVWKIDRPRESKLHPTMKPIELCENAIKNSSKRGDIVLDIFGGSGSTLIACERTGRICHMMEIDPKYCSVIIERWENETEKKAECLK